MRYNPKPHASIGELQLYSKELPTVTIAYNGNKNTGGTKPTNHTEYVSSSATPKDKNTLVKTGPFEGWKKENAGTTLKAGANNSTATIKAYAGKGNELEKKYNVDLSGSTNGVLVNGKSYWKSSFLTPITTKSNGMRDVHNKPTECRIFIVNKQSAGTHNDKTYQKRSAEELQNTTCHELGHILGWDGHSTSTSDLMTGSGTSNNSIMKLTSRDYTQVYQFIKAYGAKSNFAISGDTTKFLDEAIPMNEIPQAQPTQNIKTINTTTKIDGIKSALSFTDNIIIGTPIEMVKGDVDVLSPSDEECMMLLTDYTFKVADFVKGEQGEQTINVRSQVGNAFEIGKEYIFAANHINNSYWDSYNIIGHNHFVDIDIITSAEKDDLLSYIRNEKIVKHRSVTKINNKAIASSEYMGNVDVAFIATVKSFETDEMMYDNVDANVELIEMLKGAIKPEILNERLLLKGDIKEGETYLLLFTANKDGNLSLSSKEGSVLNVNDPSLAAYIQVLK